MHCFHNPVRTVAGPGALDALPKLLGDRSAALLTFGEAQALGLVDAVRQRVGDRLTEIISHIAPNPDVSDLCGLYPAVWRSGAEVLIALGGGSVIDTAKAMVAGTPSGEFTELRDWLRHGSASGPGFAPPSHKALIAIPTTAGTGSEVTPWATVWDREQQSKHSLQLDCTWPEAAVIDPTLMHSLPPSVTLQSGLDALSHALEALWNRHANPVSDALAIAAAKSIQQVLPRLMAQLDHPGLREAMAVAALQAGLAFSNTRTALAHSMSYAMTLRHGLPHGIACSFTLPLVARLAIGRDAARDAALAEALGPLQDAPARLESFLQQLGIKTAFADYGVTDDEASQLLDQALVGDRGRNFIGAAA